MAKKNVHRRNRTSGTDSSSSKDDEFVSSSSSSEEESASSSSSEEVVKYLDSRSYKRLKEKTGYHSEEWEETDPESEWPVVIPAVIEKIREPLNPDDDPDEIDPNDLELWLEKDLTIKEALRLLLHKRTDPTVNLLKTKQATLKYKRIDGYVHETGMPPIGAPSWCLNKVALERLNRSTEEIPIYDWDSEDGSYNGDDNYDDDNNSPDDIDNNNRAESSKTHKRKKRKYHKKESKKRKSKKSK
ncbi:unnamed protein product [Rhizophagus irregularis]|nr:unnamed protein product [Rhizophagus irregularis]